MKKFTGLLLAIFAVICLFSACTDNKPESSEKADPRAEQTQEISVSSKLRRFYRYLTDNAYADAAAEYRENILGNAQLEAEAEECISQYLKQVNDGVLSGRYDRTAASAMVKTVERLCDEADIEINGYFNMREAIEASMESKVAYKSGVSLFESGNYAEAIAELSKVLPNDSDYADAQSRLKTAGESYARDVIAKAKAFSDGKEYMQAVSLLKEAVKVLPEDIILAADLNTYEKQYKAYVISCAEEAFGDYTKYEEAARIIQAGLQQYPDDAEFAGKRDYYNSFAPVRLAQLTVYEKRCVNVWDYEKDPKGDTHADVISTDFSSDGYIVYVLDGKYNKLVFTVFGAHAGMSGLGGVTVSDCSGGDYDKAFKIYDDQKIKNSVLPYEVEVDVTGVQMLRIWISQYMAVADAVVQRTVK